MQPTGITLGLRPVLYDEVVRINTNIPEDIRAYYRRISPFYGTISAIVQTLLIDIAIELQQKGIYNYDSNTHAELLDAVRRRTLTDTALAFFRQDE